ncbi:dipeptide/oligopeptide/nickel ABC transporter permease/ATP-binding protein [Microbacterium hydrocarbonoxydans]|uniref:dipeptide/oligopeptide/nickel ABC transporter permease/ATP-binding protein n=1 Tax=Microbacterium hydrocarbonoxydans TaxID=273678 RepID=UPI00203EE0D0|nr:dipeptide/oligopeptide/nickel ABC transporter permease/ATP-binding protein [Microbacterium hydrocarbonoxydans]MCM3778414.1 dipeptide/oligopeptide/nickel ABC transporter permease/ATP-binding protein [Microbacterium hydrocarbonoxydans]
MTSLRAFLRNPLAVVALGFIVVVVLACAFANLVAPYGPLVQDLASANQLPSAAHWLGTDTLGRDILSRLLHGGQTTLVGTLIATVVFVILGVPLGLVAGYRRGWIDTLLSRTVEILFAVPVIVILLVVLSVFSTSIVAAMITLGILGFGSVFRVVRATTIAASAELYVRAARASGLRPAAIVAGHILPNLAGPVTVQVTLFAASAVLVESGLAFLGFSVAPPAPSWGAMVKDAAANLTSNPWELVPPGLLIALFVLALGIVGDGARDAVTQRGSAPTRTKAGRQEPIRETTPHDPDALLSVRGLTVAFGSTVVVRDVGFDVAPGEVVGIVGESGSGKSVTGRAVLGLLARGGRIVAGSVRFQGADVTRGLARRRGSGIGLIPQEPMNTLDPVFTIGSQLREAVRTNDRSDRRATEARMIELLGLVGLPHAADVARMYPHELSGGMAQRVGIALALASRPSLLIADEPTTALDVTVQRQILDLLADLRERLGTSIVLVTHDWGVLADLCDRALVMYAGELVEQADIVDLFAEPLHPYTRALIAANPQTATPGEPLPVIPGQVPEPAHWPVGCHFADRCPLVTDACRAGAIPLVVPEDERESRCIRTHELKAVHA